MDEIQTQLIKYHRRHSVWYLTDIYNNKSLFEIILKERDEKIHSRMIKWLFELDSLPCNRRGFPIMNLLLRIFERAKQQNVVISTNQEKDILVGKALIKG